MKHALTQRRKGRGAICSFVLMSNIIAHGMHGMTQIFLTEEQKDIFFWGHTENTDLHRILTEVHKNRFFSRRGRRVTQRYAVHYP